MCPGGFALATHGALPRYACIRASPQQIPRRGPLPFLESNEGASSGIERGGQGVENSSAVSKDKAGIAAGWTS